jgi:hypothetical protein
MHVSIFVSIFAVTVGWLAAVALLGSLDSVH